ncbi:MAG: hypothetical protein JRI66_12260 [Deltaproteobacteria bacterium]|nr:hypothetical protein [Deltaproteobacteria bacterium]
MIEWFKCGFGLSIGIGSGIITILLMLGLIETITTTIRFALLKMKLKEGAGNIVQE